MLSLSVQHDVQLHAMNVTSAFLNANLKENIYLSQPEGFINSDKKDHVLHLNITLYGVAAQKSFQQA